MDLRRTPPTAGSLYAQVEDAAIGPITVRMVNNATGAVLGAAPRLHVKPGPWKRYEYKLTTGAESRLRSPITLSSPSPSRHGLAAAGFADAADLSTTGPMAIAST